MYYLQDLDFFQDVFFPDLLDKKISPIDVVPSDFFPMTGESWAPHLLTEEERRNFDQFDGVHTSHRDSAYHKDHHHGQHSSSNNHAKPHQGYRYKNNNNHVLRQQSTPEQLNSHEQQGKSYEDGRNLARQDKRLDNGAHRTDHRDEDDLTRPPHGRQNSREQGYPNHPYHTGTQPPLQHHQQPFENTNHSSAEANSTNHRSSISNSEVSRLRSQDLVSYPETTRSADFPELRDNRESGRHIASASQHNTVSSPPSHYSRGSGSSIEPATAASSSPTVISPSAAYKSVETPPTITLKAPSSYTSHKAGSDYGSNHPRTKHNVHNQRFSNHAFGYLGPGPPYNVDPSSASNGS
ncbi:hypothetical protein EGW08_008931, partial [Elysia chlorotica]